MSFNDDEASAEDNRPVELYQISLPTKSYYFVSGNRDWTTGSTVWKAIPIARTEIIPGSPGKPNDISVSLPVNHEIVTRYLQLGTPPRTIDVTIWRQQIRSGELERIWGGRVTSLAVEGRVAKLRIPMRATESMLRVLPQTTRGRLCPHILYDEMCNTGGTVPRATYRVTTTVLAVSGRDVRVDLGNVNKKQPWAEGGELVHVASTERRSIFKQDDLTSFNANTLLTLQMPIPELKHGDSVEIYAGCDHTIKTCSEKFANQRNFGGMPSLNTKGTFSFYMHIRDLE